MFFPEKITQIKNNDRVLEIGPGAGPHSRSDIYLEKLFEPEEYIKQCGNEEARFDSSKAIYYEGGVFPFKDNEFDYVICSHVIEHVPSEDLPLFISEMQRIAPRGYLEFPAAYYEILCFPEGHLWFMNYRDGEILLFPRAKFQQTWFHKTMQAMWYQKGYSYRKEKRFFFIGFEWESQQAPLKYRILEEFNDLVTGEEYKTWKTYFESSKVTRKKSLRKRLNQKVNRIFNKNSKQLT